MSLPIIVLVPLVFTLHFPASCKATETDTVSAGKALTGNDMLVSSNGKFALGFFKTSSESSHNASNWYLGIWFNQVSKHTPVWVANGDKPVTSATSPEATVYGDGNLVILDQATKSIIWSTQANITANTTMAKLSDDGNLVLQNTNSSLVFWQSFDYPTNTHLAGAKLGWNKVTGLNRRLVSRKNSVDPASGMYSYELIDNNGSARFILSAHSSISYWSSGEWNGHYFGSIPEMTGKRLIDFTFVSNDEEEYFTYTLLHNTTIMRFTLDISGQAKIFLWVEQAQDWVPTYTNPKQCDVYGICGAFTICEENKLPVCSCMKGFSIRSPNDWDLGDRTGGCMRNTPLDCGINKNTSVPDRFLPMPCVGLPNNGHNIEDATSSGVCAQVCLSNCTCTAYYYGNNGCFVWNDELINVKQLPCDDNTDGATIYLRLAAKEVQGIKSNRRPITIGVVIGASVASFALLTVFLILMIRRNKSWLSGHRVKKFHDGSGIIAFRYADLQHATNNFSDKLGAGGFGSVFKGFLTESNIIAVKRLDGARQGEKQFRAEVRSIGIIQHINLVKLIGFCCESDRRLLVYEHMPNLSLDTHLFHSNTTSLKWSTRYQIALGVARGLAYLHDSCRDCIIHCDIKPENILLDSSFVPKITDFGMAKFLEREFSQVLTTVRGTIGYLAPEWISGTVITSKVDVYSYGMVLLEIISGRRNSSKEFATRDDYEYFPVLVAHKLLNGDAGSLVDQNLHGDVHWEQVERAFRVACWCIQDNELDRPTMSEVVQYLEGFLEVGIPPVPRLLQAIAGNPYSE
ncbi:G-type lectin S-receptor-like serine/threonine-protein kinase At2g19130 [Oryza brachyantha]|uniref:Receptor-like serine/threonine-protein kinase n=1 Tax=Oryza brachyantha TaxID=4533 RepID=J3LXT3_ORYBR|nr:G-type lectin S-receptor-like serine/threonine-protein kinase At2g19130 [Oryza brachyantha]